MKLHAHPVHATPLAEPSPWPRRLWIAAQGAVLFAGIGVVLAIITVWGAPL